MAQISGKPFLYYLIAFLKKNEIEHFIFSVGYLHEVIEKYLQENYSTLNYTICLETQPLGTGGAIKLACTKTSQNKVVVCNGDTFYNVDLNLLDTFHEKKNAACTLCLKSMQNFDRYGVVELNKDDSIKTFKEKQFYSSGLINGGVYELDVAQFLHEDLPDKFSFEKDYLEKNVAIDQKPKLYGIIQNNYFIDIGVPEDYEKAQHELSKYS